jgi:hypothetical protein
MWLLTTGVIAVVALSGCGGGGMPTPDAEERAVKARGVPEDPDAKCPSGEVRLVVVTPNTVAESCPERTDLAAALKWGCREGGRTTKGPSKVVIVCSESGPSGARKH